MRCANPVPPDGGRNIRKDNDPPKVLKTEPEFASTNVQTNRIQIHFDEYVVLQDVFNQVLVSPPLEEPPNLRLRKKTLIVKLPDDLRENTTYSINFGEAVKDFREGNVLQNLNFVFSTGSFLDSGKVEGQVKLVKDGTAPECAIVGLYKSDTTGVVRDNKPYYFAFTREDGSFVIPYLADGTYFLYAFSDDNFNYRYDLPGSEYIGFLDQPVLVPDSTAVNLGVGIFQESGKPGLLKVSKGKQGEFIFAFNQPVSTLLINSSRYSEGDFVQYNAGKDSFFYWSANMDTGIVQFDIEINKTFLDSSRVAIENPLARRVKLLEADSIKVDLNEAYLELSAPLVSFDSSRFKIYGPDSTAIPFSLGILKRDKLIVRLESDLKAKATLQILDSALFSIYNQTNQAKNYQLIPSPAAKFGSVKVTYQFDPTGSPFILEVVNAKGLVVNTLRLNEFGQGESTIRQLPQANYNFRVYEDQNRDGIWTTGILDSKSQPEEYIYRKTNVTVKGNWETEVELIF
jgi:hypothetical protein